MCGIFGLAVNKKNKFKPSDLIHDIEALCLLSQKRGQDATGLVVQSGHQVTVLKRGGNAYQMTADPRFTSSIIGGYDAPEASLGVIGHCRLVTNGSMAVEDNNQPIISGQLIGIHNGIITNAERLGGRQVQEQNSGPTAESVWTESDTKAFYSRVHAHMEEGLGTSAALSRVFLEIEGSASIAAINKEEQSLVLGTNTGSLFYVHVEDTDLLVFASEKMLLQAYLEKSKLIANAKKSKINQIHAGNGLVKKYADTHATAFTFKSEAVSIKTQTSSALAEKAYVRVIKPTTATLKRCTKCILPHTYPLISFDEKGVCNFCRRYEKQTVFGEKALEQFLAKYRSKDGSPDCLVGLSGGRDSCYGIHILKTKYNMNPIAYTFDWGLTTDISRRNQAKVCGKLGIEHILRAPDIQMKRSYVRKNVHAFLKKPHLGMVPLFMAGDKDFYHFGRQLRDENKLPLTVFCSGHSLEQRDFMTGFCGVDENIQNNKRLYKFSAANKIKLAAFYGAQYLKNPSYINASLVDSIRSFIYSFISRDDFLYLFEYLPWNEAQIEKLLNEEYQWEADKKYGKNQWRMGDGQTAFTNYIYHTVAGFSEFDNFRSNQIREGMITRDVALELVEQDNLPKWDTLNYFSHVIGINLDEVLRDVNNIPKLYQ